MYQNGSLDTILSWPPLSLGPSWSKFVDKITELNHHYSEYVYHLTALEHQYFGVGFIPTVTLIRIRPLARTSVIGVVIKEEGHGWAGKLMFFSLL